MSHSSTQINKHLKSLQKHLADEHPDNPTLAKAVKSFRKMDYVGHSMGLLSEDESYATCVTWWPMIAVLGTFSAGKSTYIRQNALIVVPNATKKVDIRCTRSLTLPWPNSITPRKPASRKNAVSTS